MRLSETLELSIPDDMDIDKLKRYLAREIKRFGKQVFGRILQEMETKKLEEAKGKVGRPGESTAVPVHPLGADKVLKAQGEV